VDPMGQPTRRGSNIVSMSLVTDHSVRRMVPDAFRNENVPGAPQATNDPLPSSSSHHAGPHRPRRPSKKDLHFSANQESLSGRTSSALHVAGGPAPPVGAVVPLDSRSYEGTGEFKASEGGGRNGRIDVARDRSMRSSFRGRDSGAPTREHLYEEGGRTIDTTDEISPTTTGGRVMVVTLYERAEQLRRSSHAVEVNSARGAVAPSDEQKSQRLAGSPTHDVFDTKEPTTARSTPSPGHTHGSGSAMVASPLTRTASGSEHRGGPPITLPRPRAISVLPSDFILAQVPCGHIFHKQCIESWAETKSTCPVCRAHLGTGQPEGPELNAIEEYEREEDEEWEYRSAEDDDD